MTRKARIQKRLQTLYKIADSFDGVASESISTPNGGSRSVTYTSLSQVQDEIDRLEAKLAAIEQAETRPDGFGVSYARWC